jgi:hypothetical protein
MTLQKDAPLMKDVQVSTNLSPQSFEVLGGGERARKEKLLLSAIRRNRYDGQTVMAKY